MTEVCAHLDQIRPVTPSAEGCEDCLRTGATWVHLRLCMSCGHVGCCDSSPNKHATRHFHSRHHPIIKSFQPGEEWGWCYVMKSCLIPCEGPSFARKSFAVMVHLSSGSFAAFLAVSLRLTEWWYLLEAPPQVLAIAAETNAEA